MTLCSCRPFIRRTTDLQDTPDLYKSAYSHSYFYQNAVYHPFVHARMKQEIRDDFNPSPESVLLNPLESVNQSTFGPKYTEHFKFEDFFRNSSSVTKATLKSLHEKYVGDPPRPIKWGSTTTGSTYVQPEKIHEPKSWAFSSPIEESTCAISSPCRDGLPTFLPNESGYIKHSDPYISTSQLTHCNFSEEQQNGVARKNILTFWDTTDLPKNWGFGPKKLEPFGSYFHREESVPYRVQTKPAPRVPFSGNTSTYGDSYHFVPTNLMHQEKETIYPAVYKPIDVGSYCTEQCHVGTGWPVRGQPEYEFLGGLLFIPSALAIYAQRISTNWVLSRLKTAEYKEYSIQGFWT